MGTKSVAAAPQKGRGIARPIVDGLSEAIITLDEQRRIQSANQAAQELFDYSHQELSGRAVDDLVAQHILPRLKVHLSALLSEGSRVRGRETWLEAEAIRNDSSSFPLALWASSMRLNRGRLAIGVLRDISQPSA